MKLMNQKKRIQIKFSVTNNSLLYQGKKNWTQFCLQRTIENKEIFNFVLKIKLKYLFRVSFVTFASKMK